MLEGRKIWLPALLTDVREAFGLAAALRLAQTYGGLEIYLPASISADHRLAKELGADLAAWLAEHHGPGKLTIPMGPTASHHRRRERIARLTAEGYSAPKVARMLGIHERSVRRNRSRGRAEDERQGRLF